MNRAHINALPWRCIGPHRGGRVVAVAGCANRSSTFYFGSTGGGVWKSEDAGQTWLNVSDEFFRRASVGALAVAPSDENVIYAGMGETTIRGNVSHGDGVYRSTDGGATWQHLGLEATRHVGKIRVHPENPDLVYVAAFGHAHGSNPDRGLYRSRDGGKNWEQVLFVSERAGIIDLCIDATNPRILYASSWEAERGPHYMTSGGPGSNIYRSTDDGNSWTCLDTAPGLPAGIKGKIGIAASPAQTGRVWAIIEHSDGGVFRSDDFGDSWERLNTDGELRARAWYYSHIIADPVDQNTVWVPNLKNWKSIDGGSTFTYVPTPHDDCHDIWINPENPENMILGCDGGATVSLNGGRTWSTIFNQPTAEFYHVTTDSREPYRVYGAQQDNSTLSIPSRSNAGFISQQDWYKVGGGESASIAVHPDDPDVVFASDHQGRITRYNHRTGEIADISVWPEHFWGVDAVERRYRFAWSFPLVLSPHKPYALYAGNNHVFRSHDEGRTWEKLSPDLTRNDPLWLRSIEPVGENANGDVYGTLLTIAESPVHPGMIWVGSDDGRVHVTRDDGKTWEDVTPEQLPEWSLISNVEPSPFDGEAAFMAAERHKLDDFSPHLYRTDDGGKSWTRIVDGIASDDFVRVVRQDPVCRDLLYAGTEGGLYVSIDSGEHWELVSGNLPCVPIHDITIRDGDLILATHGRGFWIFDDLTPLRTLADVPEDSSAFLFRPRMTPRWIGMSSPVEARLNQYRYSGSGMAAFTGKKGADGSVRPLFVNAGMNPPDGVIITYFLFESPSQRLTLTITDTSGNEIRSWAANSGDSRSLDTSELPARPGLNRFVWNMRVPDPVSVSTPGGDRMNATGPRVVPGVYGLVLTADDQTMTEEVEILRDPRSTASQADLEAQFALVMKIQQKLSEANQAINRIRSIRSQIENRAALIGDLSQYAPVLRRGDEIAIQLSSIEAELIQVDANDMEDTLRLPAKLNAKLAWLSMTVGDGHAAPTTQHYDVYGDLAARVDDQLTALCQVIASDMAEYEELSSGHSLPAIFTE